MKYKVKETAAINILPDVEVVSERFLLCLVTAPHMVPPALVGDKLPVRLNNHCVEVFDAINHIRGHGVARTQG